MTSSNAHHSSVVEHPARGHHGAERDCEYRDDGFRAYRGATRRRLGRRDRFHDARTNLVDAIWGKGILVSALKEAMDTQSLPSYDLRHFTSSSVSVEISQSNAGPFELEFGPEYESIAPDRPLLVDARILAPRELPHTSIVGVVHIIVEWIRTAARTGVAAGRTPIRRRFRCGCVAHVIARIATAILECVVEAEPMTNLVHRNLTLVVGVGGRIRREGLIVDNDPVHHRIVVVLLGPRRPANDSIAWLRDIQVERRFGSPVQGVLHVRLRRAAWPSRIPSGIGRTVGLVAVELPASDVIISLGERDDLLVDFVVGDIAFFDRRTLVDDVNKDDDRAALNHEGRRRALLLRRPRFHVGPKLFDHCIVRSHLLGRRRWRTTRLQQTRVALGHGLFVRIHGRKPHPYLIVFIVHRREIFISTTRCQECRRQKKRARRAPQNSRIRRHDPLLHAFEVVPPPV